MPIMSFIACRMFEDEIVHIIENDPETEKVVIIENEDCFGITQKLDSIGYKYDLLPLSSVPES